MRHFVAAMILLVLAGLIVGGYMIYQYLGAPGMSAWGSYLTGVGTLLFAAAAAYAAIQALEEYKARTRTERARWTTELFHKFYEEGHSYRFIRQKIDYDDVSDIFALIRRDGEGGEFSQEERDLFDKFTDYLNFFEYIAYLLERKQLDRSDVRAMFEYYLRRMVQIANAKEELAKYIKDKEGFKRFQDESMDILLHGFARGAELIPTGQYARGAVSQAS